MKVTIERKYCQGHAVCNMTAPELFKIDDDGYAYVANADIPSSSTMLAKSGASACPERAIKVEE